MANTSETVEYSSHIELGETYEDMITGVKGTATQIMFDQHNDARVLLEWGTGSPTESKSQWFDASRLDN